MNGYNGQDNADISMNWDEPRKPSKIVLLQERIEELEARLEVQDDAIVQLLARVERLETNAYVAQLQAEKALAIDWYGVKPLEGEDAAENQPGYQERYGQF